MLEIGVSENVYFNWIKVFLASEVKKISPILWDLEVFIEFFEDSVPL